MLFNIIDKTFQFNSRGKSPLTPSDKTRRLANCKYCLPRPATPQSRLYVTPFRTYGVKHVVGAPPVYE
jgi:hypothetical protein